MSENPDKHRIDRILTKQERIFAIIVSGFLSVLFGSIGAVYFLMLLTSPDKRVSGNFYFFVGVTVLSIICIYILVGALSGKARKPSAFKAKLTGYLILVVSIIIIPLVLLLGEGANRFYLLSLSLAGIPMGINIIKQGSALEEHT